MLYRACYARDGKALGVTFHAATNDEADGFVRLWEKCAKVEVLTVKCLGTGHPPEVKRPMLQLVP